MTMLETGQIAPDFSLPRDGNGTVTLSELRGGAVVLFFYPKDDTSGCTAEARGFTEAVAEFGAAGATVLGISKDTVKKHDAFRDKHALGVALLSDAEDGVCEAYGVWVEKKMYGRTFMGIERATYLIDAEGRIARIWRKVKVPGHVAQVLEAARAL